MVDVNWVVNGRKFVLDSPLCRIFAAKLYAIIKALNIYSTIFIPQYFSLFNPMSALQAINDILF